MNNDVKRFLMCLIASLLAFGTLHAQNVREEQTVRLKDGSKVTGVVVRNADGSITVTTRDNDTFYYGANEIRSIDLSEKAVKEAERQKRLAAEQEKERRVQEKARKEQEKIQAAEDKRLAKEARKQERRDRRDWRQANGRGYMPILETGLGVDRTFLDARCEYGGLPLSYREDYLAFQFQLLHWINGYSFSPYFYLGAGVGLNCVPQEYSALMSLYLHLRTTMSRSRVAPYFALSLGGTGPFEVGWSPYADAQLGLRIGRKKKAGSWIGLSASYLNPEYISHRYYYIRGYRWGDNEPEVTGYPYKLLLSLKYSISF